MTHCDICQEKSEPEPASQCVDPGHRKSIAREDLVKVAEATDSVPYGTNSSLTAYNSKVILCSWLGT
jgi:hypothetical protein